ncbi:MAG: D-2-hydroxyacid dehydrogenase [Haloferacaceae archaeon]
MTDRPTVLVPHSVSPERTDELRAELEAHLDDLRLAAADTPDETDALLPEADAIVTFSLSAEDLERAGNLRWVQALSAGVDAYPLDALAEAGVALTNASGVHAEPIAEQVLCYMLMFARALPAAARNQERNVWERTTGGELRGKTVGVVGVGAIGGRVAELASALGTEVLGTKRDTSETPDGVDELYPADEYHEVLKRSDYVVLACPLTDATRRMIGTDEFRLMSGDSVLVNIARGAVVDESALERALQSHRIRGAALDVFEEEPLPADSPLWDLSNVVVTPHTAGATPHYLERCADLVAENYERFVAGEDLVNRVN